ncbi:PREDICTED: transcription initiation factor TFIID subunit 11-like [Brassica oleracea var. oleracea]|uniref:transcription initiation factor TFIID subunit 11-like n=1 Tax=Brassica oleracea var. oleracea TaxID=109376 RepID=UPI0006A6D118|nr:PREDICTED: transcription initiation factor TFIID subunit 11-like [Brassica oleracea var. oleracea]
MNTLYFKSLFCEDLYKNPTKSLQDAIARSNNFIRMEKDTAAILKKMNATPKPTAPKAPEENDEKSPTAPKAPEARQEPRQHATCNKSNQQKNFVYVVEDKNPSGSTVVVREKGWNVWENDEKSQTPAAPSTSNPGMIEQNLWCSYHKSKAHDTRNCRHLVDALFSSYENGTANVELPKPRPNNTKRWSKNKEKKAQKNQDKAGARPRRAEDDKPEEQDEDEGEAQVEEEQPRNHRRVQVILARPSSSSDEEEDNKVRDSHEHSGKRPSKNSRPEGSYDLRSKLR